LGERLLCKQEVIGSIPFTSTTVATTLQPRDRRCANNAEGDGAVRRGSSDVWRSKGDPLGAWFARGGGGAD
jgi:hypothetical protein